MYSKSLGPRGRGPKVLGVLGPRPLGPWDLRYLGLKVWGPKVRGLRAQGLMALESLLLQVYLKSPKEARLSDGVVVDLFFTAWFFCPVAAFKKYLASLPFSPAAGSSIFPLLGQSSST